MRNAVATTTVAVCLLVTACGVPPRPPAGDVAGAAPVIADAGAIARPAPAVEVDASVPVIAAASQAARQTAARVHVSELAGRSSDEAGLIFAPAQDTLETCRRGTGGKVLVRMSKVGGRTRFDIEPGSSLDPTEKRCVLEALSQSNVDESSTLSQGGTVRPSGFTSLITIAW